MGYLDVVVSRSELISFYRGGFVNGPISINQVLVLVGAYRKG